MSIHVIGKFDPLPERPGMRSRKLIATEHGFTSFFVGKFEMDQGASVPLHTHPVEEAVVVTDGALIVQLGEENIKAPAGSVVRIPPGVPHALQNEDAVSARALGAQLGIELIFSARRRHIFPALPGKTENLRPAHRKDGFGQHFLQRFRLCA
jgi:quercetin dioxygenase-like cupin family protein